MTRYQKGANFERELVDEFWKNGWTAIRAAGSGITRKVPDVIAMKDNKVIVIECKTTKKAKLSLKDAILTLEKFSSISGSKAYIAIRFPREKPRFYSLENLITAGDYTITISDKYLSFDSIIGQQSRLSD